jgi:hypothetical protein
VAKLLALSASARKVLKFNLAPGRLLGDSSPQRRQSAELFLQSSDLGPLQPLTRRRVGPPPPGSEGEGHTRWRERGWESPSSDEWIYVHCGTLYICIYIYALCARH